jgi:hypothetical protein
LKKLFEWMISKIFKRSTESLMSTIQNINSYKWFCTYYNVYIETSATACAMI